MDDESGESMEQTEEVPLKEPGEKESGASLQRHTWWRRLRIQNLRGEVTNVACKEANSFRECALKIALSEALFSPKCTKCQLAAGLRLTSWGRLQTP